MNCMKDQEHCKGEFFDTLAEEWEERGFAQEELPRLERLFRRLGDLRGTTVFEPGCGTGRLTVHLAEKVGPAGHVIAVEVSTRMVLAASRTLCQGRDPGDCVITEDGMCIRPSETLGEVQVHVARAEDFPLPPGSIDLALLFCVFPHFDDMTGALRRFRVLLKPGGRLVISHLMGRERLNDLHEEVGEAVRKDRIPGLPVLIEMVRGAGLQLRELLDWDEEFYLEAAPGPSLDGPAA